MSERQEKQPLKGYRSERRIKRLEATDERQYMMNESYEVYEKQGAPIGAESFHYHSFYEVIYVLEGEYSSMLENRIYNLKKGDFLLIDVNVLHRYHYIEKRHDSSKRIILWISGAMLEELSGGEMNLKACFTNRESCAWHFPIYYEELLRGFLLKLVMSGGLEAQIPGAKTITDKSFLALFFSYLNLLCNRGEYLFDAVETMQQGLVKQVNDYIEEHIRERITTEELADAVLMSRYYFLRKFKELTGVTVHSYLLQKRLIVACEELKRGVPVTRVWQDCGFSDYSSFLRNFKQKMGISPKNYIKDYQFLE